MKDIVITLVQSDLVWEKAENNRTRLETALSTVDSSTDLIILPEMFTTGFTMEAEKYAENMDGPSIQWMEKNAVKTGAGIIGSLIIKEEQNYFNRLIYVSPQGELKWYDKHHLFSMAGEDAQYSAGGERIIIKVNGWKVLPLICYDLRFPVWSRIKKDEADLVIYVANWPKRRAQHWHVLLQARAIENQAYVAGVNRIGKDGKGIQYIGSSMVIDPLGNELCNLRNKQIIETCRLSRQTLDNYRQKFPVWKDSDRFEIQN